MNKQQLGIKIKQAREQRGLTQLDLAEIMDQSRSLVCQWESGNREPRGTTLVKLMLVLDLQFFSKRKEEVLETASV